MTAADQPTTEANARQAIIDALDGQGAFCGTCGRQPGDPIDDCKDCAEVLGKYADTLLVVLTPAPQPAAEAECRVVWGRAFRTGDGALFVDDQEGAFQDREDVTNFVRPGNPESPYDLIVKQYRTPWEEA